MFSLKRGASCGAGGELLYLLLKIEEAILVLIEVGEHVEALSFTNVVDHVVLEELVDVVGADLSQLHAVDALEGSPGFETVLLGELLSLLLHDLLVLRDRLEQLKYFVASRLSQHIYFSSKMMMAKKRT